MLPSAGKRFGSLVLIRGASLPWHEPRAFIERYWLNHAHELLELPLQWALATARPFICVSLPTPVEGPVIASIGNHFCRQKTRQNKRHIENINGHKFILSLKATLNLLT